MLNSRAQDCCCDIVKAAKSAGELRELYLSQDLEKVPLSERLPKSQFRPKANVTAFKLDVQVLPLIVLLHPV